MNAYSRFIVRWAGLITLLGLILSVVSGYYSVQLFSNLRTDLEELLPTTAKSVLDFKEVVSRLNSTDNLAILIFSKDKQASRKLVDDLARELETHVPKDVLAGVEYNISKELKFFSSRKALYMELGDLHQVRDYIRNRIKYEKELYNPLHVFSGQEIPEPQYDFAALEQKYAGKASIFSRFPGGYYASEDESLRIVLANLPGGSGGITAALNLQNRINDTLHKLNPKSYASDIEIKFAGGARNNIEEHEALIEDLFLSTLVVLILVAGAMVLYYRSISGTAALVISLLMGTVWTFGLSWPLVGYLNANSAFMGAVIMGNGINFGIIFLARYMEERRKKRGNIRAIHVSLTNTATATWTASLAAGLAYGSLMLTTFRGFRQFGLIGLIGMILCWISAFTVLPAMLTLFDRIRPIVGKNARAPRQYFAGAVAWLVQKFSKQICILTATYLIFCIGAMMVYRGQIIQTDLSKLRNKHSMRSGSGYWSRVVDEIFGRNLTPIAVMPHSREDAYKIAKLLKEEAKKIENQPLFGAVRSYEDFLPGAQWEKIQALNEIRQLLYPELITRLTREDRLKVADFLDPKSFQGVSEEALPELIREKFREKDGTIGNLVLIEPAINAARWPAEDLFHFIRTIRSVTAIVDPAAPVAGALPVSADMFECVFREGPRATLFAFLAVVVLVIFLFRRIRSIFHVSFGLLIGVIWMIGTVLTFDIKVNFLNFIAFPITFGIGVDYGVNIFQRYTQEGRGQILRVIRETGGAVALASLTTIIGFGSLLIASNQAFVSFGVLAVLGEITCVTAAILSLPAFLYYRDSRKIKNDL